MNKWFVLILVVSVTLFLMPLDTMAQCSVCRSAVETGTDGSEESIARGVNNGILYLMAVPYLLAGLTAFIIYRHIKSRKTAEAQ
jgi:hypothetical protein